MLLTLLFNTKKHAIAVFVLTHLTSKTVFGQVKTMEEFI